ncbi:helix-turn-helix domain-containing protein [Thiorhodovibrio litoralis]|uniref:helix-turn-helix domain-containing protein n=1 Tax=Thiorhodovibrio litoralis TaxID=2952932 RepID=UPI002B25F2B7|nr:helix-turn-helix domain-containing protein [Thiorhodovibrio litoralis]
MTGKLLYRYAEAAELLGISDRTLRRLVDSEKILSVHPCERTPRIPKQALNSYVKGLLDDAYREKEEKANKERLKTESEVKNEEQTSESDSLSGRQTRKLPQKNKAESIRETKLARKTGTRKRARI